MYTRDVEVAMTTETAPRHQAFDAQYGNDSK